MWYEIGCGEHSVAGFAAIVMIATQRDYAHRSIHPEYFELWNLVRQAFAGNMSLVPDLGCNPTIQATSFADHVPSPQKPSFPSVVLRMFNDLTPIIRFAGPITRSLSMGIPFME